MAFLPRRSLSHNPTSNPGSPDTKPLPSLPAFEPIENVPRRLSKRRAPPLAQDVKEDGSKVDGGVIGGGMDSVVNGRGGGGNGGGGLIRRVSSMFRHKRKDRPPGLKSTNNTPFNSLNSRKFAIPEQDVSENEGSDNEDPLDDIRRPSGLGSAVSCEMLPPSPYTSEFNLGQGLYSKSRAASSPNLLRSFNLKAKKSLRRIGSRGGSLAQASAVLAQKPPIDWPAEVLDVVLSYLPRRIVASVGHLSRSFCSAARVTLYHRLDLDTLSYNQFQKLLALLASRRDLTDLVQECVCYTWPSWFAGKTVQDQLLVATFTLVFQRMSNLVKLTLPSFDQSLLACHTAFGLRSLTFMLDSLSVEETSMLFQWLDGQINITELKFPNLEDIHETASFVQEDSTVHRHQPRSSIHLKPPMPISTMNSRSNTPTTPLFPIDARTPSPSAHRQSLFGSQTLLPLLRTLHATPSILALLQPGSHNPSSSTVDLLSSSGCSGMSYSHPGRPLQSVYLNISTTLYTGLRPNAIVGPLKGSVTHLGVRFCDNVDKRTVEKVLGAIGATLGSGGDDDGWSGLQSLEVSFKTSMALMPGMEETLYKTLHTSLSRYSSLKKLHLGFLSNHRFAKTLPTTPLETVTRNDKIFTFPAPPPSGAKGLQRKGSYQLRAFADAASALYPSMSSIRGPSLRRSKSQGAFKLETGSPVVDDEEKKLMDKEQARVESWTKSCPSLRLVYLSGVTWQCPPGSAPFVAPVPGQLTPDPLTTPSVTSFDLSTPTSASSMFLKKNASTQSLSRSSFSYSPPGSANGPPLTINTSLLQSGASVASPLPSPPPPVPPLPAEVRARLGTPLRSASVTGAMTSSPSPSLSTSPINTFSPPPRWSSLVRERIGTPPSGSTSGSGSRLGTPLSDADTNFASPGSLNRSEKKRSPIVPFLTTGTANGAYGHASAPSVVSTTRNSVLSGVSSLDVVAHGEGLSPREGARSPWGNGVVSLAESPR